MICMLWIIDQFKESTCCWPLGDASRTGHGADVAPLERLQQPWVRISLMNLVLNTLIRSAKWGAEGTFVEVCKGLWHVRGCGSRFNWLSIWLDMPVLVVVSFLRWAWNSSYRLRQLHMYQWLPMSHVHQFLECQNQSSVFWQVLAPRHVAEFQSLLVCLPVEFLISTGLGALMP